METFPKLLTEREVADRLGIAVTTLRRWRWARRGPTWLKIGSAVRYEPTDLERFIEAGRQEPNPSAA
jgi:predicted site-specific integrase-resolvase